MSWSAIWDAPRPFLHPVRTPGGAVLTVEAPADHPWHHALWFTIKFVNGENFWEEYDAFGTLRTRNVVELPATPCAPRSTGCVRTARRLHSPRPER